MHPENEIPAENLPVRHCHLQRSPRHDSADSVRRSRTERRTVVRRILPGYARKRSDNAPGHVRQAVERVSRALIADRPHDRAQGANFFSRNSCAGSSALRGSARHRPPFCGESPKISHSGYGLRWLRSLRAGLPGFEHHHLQQSPPMGFQLHTLSGLFPLVSQTGDTHRRLTLGPSQIPSPRSIPL